eukprot:Rhum_TRINITY_DN18464_c0_g1::Rhum_TRINITY_DN18464_c0_g1_i1::g.167368::m.167368
MPSCVCVCVCEKQGSFLRQNCGVDDARYRLQPALLHLLHHREPDVPTQDVFRHTLDVRCLVRAGRLPLHPREQGFGRDAVRHLERGCHLCPVVQPPSGRAALRWGRCCPTGLETGAEKLEQQRAKRCVPPLVHAGDVDHTHPWLLARRCVVELCGRHRRAALEARRRWCVARLRVLRRLLAARQRRLRRHSPPHAGQHRKAAFRVRSEGSGPAEPQLRGGVVQVVRLAEGLQVRRRVGQVAQQLGTQARPCHGGGVACPHEGEGGGRAEIEVVLARETKRRAERRRRVLEVRRGKVQGLCLVQVKAHGSKRAVR